MRNLPALPFRKAVRVRTAAIPILLCLTLASGCKTSTDAAAAASQLTSTAATLTSYYAALATEVTETDQLYQIQAAFNPLAPYDAQTESSVTGTESEIQQREKLAAALTTLAQEFAKLTGSTAPADASTAAGNLETAVAALNIPHTSMSAGSVNIMKDAVDQIVKAVQEHKERDAAAQIDKFSSALATWFQSEEPLYNSIGATYSNVTLSLAKTLIAQNQVDPSPYLNAALSPYGLSAQITDPTLRKQVDTVLSAQVDQKSAALTAAQQTATTSMQTSLTEMASRIHLVATDKPMAFRAAPPTLADVQNWIALVPQFTPAAAASTTSKSK